MKDKKKYGKCPKCGKYSIHSFSGSSNSVMLFGDELNAQNEASVHHNKNTSINGFWIRKCVKCDYVISMGFDSESFINDEHIAHEHIAHEHIAHEQTNELSLAIKNDAMEQVLLELTNAYPEAIGKVLERYGVEL